MNTYIIEIKKVTQEDFQIFKLAINHYSETLQFLNETLRDRKYSKDLSIAIEIWFDFNKKTTVQYPAQRSTIKLSLHKAYILLDALHEFKTDNYNHYQKSRCTRFYMAIEEQLPTYTQLSISN